MISSIIFILLLIAAIFMFYRSVSIISKNIKLGKDINISDKKPERWRKMFLVAIGQSKMAKRPIAGIFHILVYVGFIIVNIEMLEILIDGIIGSHRIFSEIPFYNIIINVFEVFAVLVILACAIFLIRRNFLRLNRFHKSEMKLWPRLDANIILIAEILLMFAFLSMNASDRVLQLRGFENYHNTGGFLISGYLIPIFDGLSTSNIVIIERFAWWFHIIGVFAFLNYVPYSKHFHIILAFPNVYYSKLEPRAYLANMDSVTEEVKIALGLIQPENDEAEIEKFGAKDVQDLNWKQLMDSYSCTECGRCTDVCPANITGKLLSPRKVVMDTRDRLEVVGKEIDKNEKNTDLKGSLLYDKISKEELWACTSCNACAEACPVEIDPLGIIMDLRRYIYLEDSAAPSEINAANTNIENNGAPWQFPADDRANWADDIFLGETKINVPIMADLSAKNKTPEYLFWVGSAGSFDDRARKISISFVKLLELLNIDYAILGIEETDSGDTAKRSGNEFVYQMQALQNIETINAYGIKKIITCNPHDFNIIKNEYKGLGGDYQVEHHTQFLARMLEKGKLILNKNKSGIITFHDPCYLGRGNSEYDAPRKLLEKTGFKLKEMPRNKSNALCCGAGGGQMFKEAEKGNKEIYVERTEEALKTKASKIISACPFCMTMLSDGVKYQDKQTEVENIDIAELILDNILTIKQPE